MRSTLQPSRSRKRITPGSRRSAACAHRQPIQGREAHGRIHALAVSHGAQAGAAAQVGDNDPAAAKVRSKAAQTAGDVLVR